ncbi:DUF4249 family protein [Xanthovirga aplysinae]|uniref:DUF4249 family protein n=1 Tax=Xanthovirga aplysinae TaxID=2529853 RepID=UPI0012BCDB50|nr:DUF4249 family protein [Xanthovirga aplysinae]MTI32600.1 DUF4249 family protein [Xanthovirga aplysinae]
MKVVIYDKRELYSEHGIFYEETGTSFTISLKGASAPTNYFQIKWRLNGIDHVDEPYYWKDYEVTNRYINLLDINNLTEEELQANEIAFIPVPIVVLEEGEDENKPEFFESFEFIGEVHSLSKENFDLLEQLKQQNEFTGGVMTSTPVQLRGNVRNIRDENELVLGYFGVSAVSEIKEFVNRKKILVKTSQ